MDNQTPNLNQPASPEPVAQPTPLRSEAETSSEAPLMRDQARQSHKSPLVLIFSLFLVLAIAASLFFYYRASSTPAPTPSPTPTATPSPSPDPIANWQTYTYKDLNFKYPPNWTLVTEKMIAVKPTENGSSEFPSISFYAIHNPDNLTVQQYDEKISKEGMDPNIYSAFIADNEKIASPKLIKGIQGYLLTDLNCEPLSCDKFSFNHNGKIYVITNVTESTPPIAQPDKQYLREIFDQIISTIEFTGSNQASTAGWQTYTNPIRKYAIRYPSDWTLDTTKAETTIDDVQGATLAISKQSYKLTITWPSAYGPGMCIFDDQDRVGAPEFASYCGGQFVDFGQHRRLVNPTNQKDHVQWPVYTKDTNSSYFVTVPPISYQAPKNYDNSVIKTMDSILETYHPN